jgi:hypothetical protein
MTTMSYVRIVLSACLMTAALACGKRSEPVAVAPTPSTTPAPAPAATPAPEPAPAAEAPVPTPVAAPPEPELPPAVQACNRKCSVDANHRQMAGFVRCEKEKQSPTCKTDVLTANDTERAACRKACEAKAAH